MSEAERVRKIFESLGNCYWKDDATLVLEASDTWIQFAPGVLEQCTERSAAQGELLGILRKTKDGAFKKETITFTSPSQIYSSKRHDSNVSTTRS